MLQDLLLQGAWEEGVVASGQRCLNEVHAVEVHIIHEISVPSFRIFCSSQNCVFTAVTKEAPFAVSLVGFGSILAHRCKQSKRQQFPVVQTGRDLPTGM